MVSACDMVGFAVAISCPALLGEHIMLHTGAWPGGLPSLTDSASAFFGFLVHAATCCNMQGLTSHPVHAVCASSSFLTQGLACFVVCSTLWSLVCAHTWAVCPSPVLVTTTAGSAPATEPTTTSLDASGRALHHTTWRCLSTGRQGVRGEMSPGTAVIEAV